MSEIRFALQSESTERHMLVKALGALAAGAALGALVAIPYDQIMGISRPLFTTLQSLIATVALTSLTCRWSGPLVLTIPEGSDKRVAGGK